MSYVIDTFLFNVEKSLNVHVQLFSRCYFLLLLYLFRFIVNGVVVFVFLAARFMFLFSLFRVGGCYFVVLFYCSRLYYSFEPSANSISGPGITMPP